MPACPLGSEYEWEDSGSSWMEKDNILRSRGKKYTDAALILQLNTEWLEARVRFPKRKQPRMKFGAVHGRLTEIPAICEMSRTNV